MQSYTWLKWLVIVLALSFSILLVIPPRQKVRLGLDLQGGYSFTVELDKAALEDTIRGRFPAGTPDIEIKSRIRQAEATADETAVEIIRNRIDALGTEEPVITRGQEGRIYVQIPGVSEEKRAEAERLIRSVAFLDFRLVDEQSDRKASALLDAGEKPRGYAIVEIQNRKYYVRDDRPDADDIRALHRFGNPEPGTIFMLEKRRIEGFQSDVYRPIFVGRRPLMTGESLQKAEDRLDSFGRPQILLSFNSEGAREFSRITDRYRPGGSGNTNPHEGRQVAIVLDNLVYTAPVINERIPNGQAVISGSFSRDEAALIRNVLNAGAMPAPLKFLGQRFVSPTLGEDAIRAASRAILIGFVAIIAFLIFYYRQMGLVAALGVVLVLLLLPVSAVIASGILGVFVRDATVSGGSLLRLPVLTLPGIAGILLTLGMAVDANVLIFERTREEQANGRRAFPAIMAGYQRAFLAIFDGNLTTIITATILFVFGTGLIRGFSITLVAGILASMFTALFVTKLIFEATVKESRQQPMKMMQFIRPDINIPFPQLFRRVIGVAITVIVVTNVMTVYRAVRNPADVFAVDFTGGVKVSYAVEMPETANPAQILGDIRSAAQTAGITDAAPQFQRTDDETFLEIKTVLTDLEGRDISDVLTEALARSEALDGVVFTHTDIDAVGSQIGNEMKRSAYIAIALSTLAILLYITLRFEFGFALGAIAALVHDVFITIGLFSVLGYQFNLTIVAAMLTIVGYGVNDTIVLFDRVREELKRDQKATFPELTNRCINITLSRTLLTSVTTLITVVSLLIFSSGDIRGFAVCMLIGIITSTFSTIFIASPVMLAWYRQKRPEFAIGK